MSDQNDEVWLAVDEALRYLGLDPWNPANEDLLEEWIVDYKIDAKTDGHGNLTFVEPTGLAKVLFDRHEKEVGHRPDDPKAMEKERKKAEAKRMADAKDRADKRTSLSRRVGARRASATRSRRASGRAGS